MTQVANQHLVNTTEPQANNAHLVVFYYGHDDFRYGVADVFFKVMAYLANEKNQRCTLVYSGDLTTATKQRLAAARIEVLSLNVAGLKACAKPLWLVLRRLQPTVVMTGTEHANLLLLMLSHVLWPKPRVVISTHSPLLIRFKQMWQASESQLLKALIRFFYPKANTVVAVSDFVKNDIVATAPNAVVKRIYNPIKPANVQRAIFNPHAVQLLVVSRLVANKCLHEALALVARQASIEQLVIVGDGPEQAVLQQQAHALQVHKRVHFAGYQTDVAQFYDAADILILPSAWEGFGNVVAEAMAHGCQVIVNTQSGAPWELLDYGRLGFGYEGGNTEQLDQAYEACLQQPVAVEKLTAKAEEFALEVVGEQYHQVLFAHSSQ